MRKAKGKIIYICVLCLTIFFISSYKQTPGPSQWVNLHPHSDVETRLEKDKKTISQKIKVKDNGKHPQIKGAPTRRIAILSQQVKDNGKHPPNDGTPTRRVITLSQQKVPSYDPAFKNPCWWTESKRLECLPYFFLAGFPKTGSTDLYARITHHPLLAAGRGKEIHYLSKSHFEDPPKFQCDKDMEREVKTNCDLYLYARTYYNHTAERINACTADTLNMDPYLPGEKSKVLFKHPMITLDGSTALSWDNWYGHRIIRDVTLPKKVRMSNATIIDWILRFNPKARFIFIMREPVAREYSSYYFYNPQYNKTALTFKYHIATSLEQFSQCLKSGTTHLDCARLWRTKIVRPCLGIYHMFIEQFLLRVPRERILFLRAEDYRNNMAQTLQQVFKFLELPLLNKNAMAKLLSGEKKNVNKKHVGPMLEETRHILTQFFRPYNKKLAKLLNDNRFLWDDVHAK